MSGVVRQDDVRRQNQFSIMNMLRRHGPLSRTAMSTLTGLSASTVTVITNNLIERGVIKDQHNSNAGNNRRGRPQVLLAPNGNYATIAVIRLSYGRVNAALYDYAGDKLAQKEIFRSTGNLSADELTLFIAEIIKGLLEENGYGHQHLTRIGINVEGIVDGSGRVLMLTPAIKHQHIRLAAAMEATFDAPTEILNDCSAIAEGLSWRSMERYGKNFAVVLMSGGVGVGLFLNGKMFSGPKSSAMEFGHTIYMPDGALCRCGRRGCVEAYAGTYGMWRAARGRDSLIVEDQMPPDDFIEELVEKARASDGPERLALKQAGRAIGTGLVNLFTLFDSVPLVFVGAGTVALEFMMDEIKRCFGNRSFGFKIEPEIMDIFQDEVSPMQEGTLMRSLIDIDQQIPDNEEIVPENNPALGGK